MVTPSAYLGVLLEADGQDFAREIGYGAQVLLWTRGH